uniref:C2H2-type domain-containing protein n=1 Tax=Leersia perrieri TaxID=77586 RepID=A0A0D9XY01_9ORYZ
MRRREDGRSAAYLVAMVLCSSCLLAVAAGSRQEFHEDAGSRERSRLAWKAIDEYLMPFVEKEKYELPSKCRLHPGNDMFREQEQHKIHFDINEWRCGFCKKAFRAEKFLDQHFENRHKNLVDNSLADSCFPINHGPSASRLHEFFLRQFCDAHTCNRGSKPFPKGGRKETNRFYLALCALIVRNEERNWHRFELFV